ncbi:MAG: methylated-DNA--[protein]-cysteine S-methyltransferase [Nitriliruptoraceae bacterium]
MTPAARTDAPTPVAWRALASPLGELLVVATGGRIAGLYFDDHRGKPAIQPHWLEHAHSGTPSPDRAVLERAALQLREYLVAGSRSAFDLPLGPTGTPFQLQVWNQLQTTGFGTTCSYRDVATAIGRPSAVRAVAAAVGRNPISIVVPCHRVVGSRGELTGYAGGLDRKRTLLDLEASAPR